MKLRRVHWLFAIGAVLVALNLISFFAQPAKKNPSQAPSVDNPAIDSLLPINQNKNKPTNTGRKSISDESIDIFSNVVETKAKPTLRPSPRVAPPQKALASAAPVDQTVTVQTPVVVLPVAPKVLGAIEKDNLLIVVANENGGSTVAAKGASLGNGWIVSALDRNQTILLNTSTNQTVLVDLRTMWAGR